MKLLQECKEAKRIGISGHIRPDGDCIGSCLALYQYLKKGLPENVYIKVYLEKPASIFSELKGFDEIDSDYPQEENFDVFFVMDCSFDRLGEAQKYFETAAKTINIDHHISNTGCGDLNYIMPQIGSASEVLYDLIVAESGEQVLDKEMAMTIYTGIIHDTGVFQYSNTTPKTMEIGAKLISYGFDFPNLILETFYQRTYVQSQVLGRALMESIRFLDGQCIVSCIDKKQMDFYEVTTQDFDGIVNHLRNIKGVHCAIFMYQTDVLEYKVSLRSDELVNVSEVAAFFGGGGHMRAAGCTMKGTFHDCVNNLSLHIEAQLKRNGALV
ncbi:MAG: bifunctional oligoribonuclease/PAP phosphatase NrnA [Lachnospiraceae bacterium]|nr:bifunctional oligoribonuclease/PAP phosphatase NrnA [Lachnospiraceae bacterium]